MWQRAGQGRLDVTLIRAGGPLLRGRVVPAVRAVRDHHEIWPEPVEVVITDRKMALCEEGRSTEG